MAIVEGQRWPDDLLDRFVHDFNTPKPRAALRVGDIVVLFEQDGGDMLERKARITGFVPCAVDPDCVFVRMEWAEDRVRLKEAEDNDDK